ncbi:MAG: DUF58 domain-containing protein [Actinomycetota bacterium]
MSLTTTMRWRAGPAHLRAVLLGLVGVSVAVLFRIPELLVFATPFAVVAVWSAATRPGMEPQGTGRLAPSDVREGQATTWSMALTHLDRVDHAIALLPQRQWLELVPRTGTVLTVVDGPEARLAMPIRPIRWGRHRSGPANVVAVSSWGAFRWMALDTDRPVTALPLPPVFDAAQSPHRGNGLIGVNRSTRLGDGQDFAAIRPFQPGDRLRRINWRRTQRDGELRVTATHADEDIHVELVVDATADYGHSDGIDGAASSLDASVRAAGAIAEHFLVRGDRVSLRVIGGRPVTLRPGAGSRHLRRLLEVLAAIDRDSLTRRTNTLTAGGLPHGSLVMLFSPFVAPAAVQQALTLAGQGLDVAVIDTLPEDVHLEEDRATSLAWRIRLLERHGELRAVQRAGVPVVRWRGAGSLDPFLRALARRRGVPRVVRS